MVNEHEASTSTKVDELSEVNSFENSSCASSDISPTYDELYNNFVELHEELKKVAKVDRNNSFRYLRIISTLPTQSSSYLHLMWTLSVVFEKRTF
ncbi:hypothetical protein Lal_00043263 [Lupinus albus]|nr:hypothetical protein Lal_00043263 [Lupinus albus]